MNLRKCILTENDCYKAGRKIKPVGIVVHSTGANNPALRRYVQPDDGLLGENRNGNHWNRPGVEKCVHAFIGKLRDGSIGTYQTLPWNHRSWGCGSGKKGSYNNSHIQFEICEDDLQDGMYFRAVYREAAQLCAYLCREYGISVENIVCHKEAHRQGYASDHGDVEHWWPKLGKTMDDFRREVRQELEKEERAMDYKEFKEHMLRFLDEQAHEALPDWAMEELEEAKEAGITDGMSPMSFIPRYQAAIMAKRAAKHE